MTWRYIRNLDIRVNWKKQKFISAIFALFFWVPKNLIYINNAFNGYRYLKSTRKELSDGTLMLKKEYCLDRWNCDWKSYTFPKKYPPSRENDQNSPKSAITPQNAKNGSFWVIWAIFLSDQILRWSPGKCGAGRFMWGFKAIFLKMFSGHSGLFFTFQPFLRWCWGSNRWSLER